MNRKKNKSGQVPVAVGQASVFLNAAESASTFALIRGNTYVARIALKIGIVVIEDNMRKGSSVFGTYDDAILVLTTDGSTISLVSEHGPNRLDQVAKELILKVVEVKGLYKVEVWLP